MAVDKQRLRLIAELENQGFIRGSKEMQKELARIERKTLKSTRRQGQAWTQIAYGLDDVQYGFRGVQNNIQALAVSAGASGPLVLGITAATVAIGYFVKKWEDANRELKKYNDELAKGQGAIATTRLYAEILRTATVGTDEHTGALEYLKSKGYDPAKESLNDFLRLQERQLVLNALEKASGDEIARLLAKRIKVQAKLAKLNKDGAPKFSALGSAGIGAPGTTPSQLEAAHSAAITRTESELAALDTSIKDTIKKGADAVTAILGEDGLVGFINRGKKKGGKKDKALTADEIAENFELADELADALSNLATAEEVAVPLNAAGDALGKAFVASMGHAVDRDLAETLGEGVDTAAAETTGKKLGQAVRSGLINAFTGLGQAIGDAISGSESFGDGLLKVLGAFMSAFGAAIIAVGVGLLNLEAGLGSLNPFQIIAGGVALVAAGAVVSGLASGGVGGAGASSGSSGGGTAQTSVTPSASRTQGANTRLVATVKGQDLRFVLQGANDSYNARG